MNFLKRKETSNHIVLKVIGGAALGLIAAGLLYNFTDIKRYIKISSM
ncbi:MAG TPA: hypothetical protein VF131_09290 [Blastocatellia bacterium]|nr:hypothetical protein [Blastocatellia bacterium]